MDIGKPPLLAQATTDMRRAQNFCKYAYSMISLDLNQKDLLKLLLGRDVVTCYRTGGKLMARSRCHTFSCSFAFVSTSKKPKMYCTACHQHLFIQMLK
jgi:hypothetical protein